MWRTNDSVSWADWVVIAAVVVVGSGGGYTHFEHNHPMNLWSKRTSIMKRRPKKMDTSHYVITEPSFKVDG